MTIPDYQSLMLPLLRFIGDGQEHSIRDAIEFLAQQFELSEDERQELLPSGSVKFNNRVAWSRTYLKKAGLLDSPIRGKLIITQRGTEVLESNPTNIDNTYLMQFPEFQEFKGMSRQEIHLNDEDEEPDQTPEEILEASYQTLKNELAYELLDRIMKCSPKFFERLVVDLLVSMGYGGSRKDAGQAVGQSGDGGIDGIIKEDKLGLDAVYVQAKRWEGTVGRPTVQAFAGSLEGQRAKKGVMITTSQFSQEAKDYVKVIEKRIVLIDGEQLAQLMIDHNVGVNEVVTYTVKKVDFDYFEDE